MWQSNSGYEYGKEVTVGDNVWFDMFAVYHVHTEFSDDSVYPMEQVVRNAIAGGMDELCFTLAVTATRRNITAASISRIIKRYRKMDEMGRILKQEVIKAELLCENQ